MCASAPRPAQAALQSGYDCGADTNDCIQPDGSGYYVASRAEVGGTQSNRYQAHNFHVVSGEDDFVNYALQDDAELNPNFIQTSAPWGMRPGFDWLASMALTPLPAESTFVPPPKAARARSTLGALQPEARLHARP